MTVSMSCARCFVLIAIGSACWAGATQATEPEEPKKVAQKSAPRVAQPWWGVVRGGGYTFQSAYGSSVGYLRPVDGPPGGVGLGMKEGLFVGVGGGRWFYTWLGVEVALSRFDVELGGDVLFGEAREASSIEIGTCALNTAQLTLLLGGDASPQNRFHGSLGIDLLYEIPGDFDLAEAGQIHLGVVEVETRSALIWGLSVRGDVRLGRGPWALTLNSTMTFGGGEPFLVRTDPRGGYLSSPVSFQPFTITIGVLRRF